jgi:hypothetical protein
MKTHVDGSKPAPDEIFVFGSNLLGRHYGGAALAAYKYYGAEWGVGVGFSGRSYAIPTLATPGGDRIAVGQAVLNFVSFARERQDLNFFITRIGCGIAGGKDEDYASLFRGAPDNCNFPEEWRQYVY